MQQVTIGDIQKITAAYFEVPITSMRSKARQQHVAQPRMIAMVLARELTHCSLPKIGQHFDRDHTTVMNALKRIESSRFLRDNANKVKEIIAETPMPDRTVTWLSREVAMRDAWRAQIGEPR